MKSTSENIKRLEAGLNKSYGKVIEGNDGRSREGVVSILRNFSSALSKAIEPNKETLEQSKQEQDSGIELA